MDTGTNVTPMKLLKLVYLSHGWYLGSKGEPLISDAVEAWRYGPVVSKVYNRVKAYGSNPITSMIDINNDGKVSTNELPDSIIQKFLNGIWVHYMHFTGLELSTITHKKNSPWDTTYKKSGSNSIIPNILIRDYYKKKIKATTT